MRQAEAKERQLASQREHHARNRARDNAAVAQWRTDNPDKVAKINKKKRDAYAADPEPMKGFQRKYRAENDEITRAYQKGYTAGIRKVYNIPAQRKRSNWSPTTPEGEHAYQKGYRAGMRKAKENPTGLKAYKPRPAKEKSSNVELHSAPAGGL
jgi:ribosome modulation factor